MRKSLLELFGIHLNDIENRLFIRLIVGKKGIALAARSMRGLDIKKKDNPNELSYLVAGGGLEPPASGL